MNNYHLSMMHCKTKSNIRTHFRKIFYLKKKIKSYKLKKKEGKQCSIFHVPTHTADMDGSSLEAVCNLLMSEKWWLCIVTRPTMTFIWMFFIMCLAVFMTISQRRWCKQLSTILFTTSPLPWLNLKCRCNFGFFFLESNIAYSITRRVINHVCHSSTGLYCIIMRFTTEIFRNNNLGDTRIGGDNKNLQGKTNRIQYFMFFFIHVLKHPKIFFDICPHEDLRSNLLFSCRSDAFFSH